jgi:aryl-alcohol dehydrogenase-like predicted oxidoreductase
MRTRSLGSRGPAISLIGFGAWEAGGHLWGSGPEDAAIVAAMHAGFDAGINWVDTAEIYGMGRSEQIVAKALASRRDVLVFTKVGGNPPGSGYDPKSIRTACEKSLARLGRDVIDLYQIHFPQLGMDVEAAWGAMAALVDDGLVRFIGVSNFDRALIERCEKVRHVDSLQPQFSLVWQEGRRDLFPYCRANGTGIIAYGPLGFGLLTGAITASTTFGDDDWRAGKFAGNLRTIHEKLFAADTRPKYLAMVDALRPIAARLGLTLGQLALAWVNQQEGVTGAIAGSRSLAHTVENARAGGVELSASDLAAIDRIAERA